MCRPSFVLVPPACGVIGGERHVIHALYLPDFLSSCSGVYRTRLLQWRLSHTSHAVALIAHTHTTSSGLNHTRARICATICSSCIFTIHVMSRRILFSVREFICLSIRCALQLLLGRPSWALSLHCAYIHILKTRTTSARAQHARNAEWQI